MFGVAKDDPKTFCGLLARVLPHEVAAEMKHSGEMNIAFRMNYKPPKE